MVKLLLPTLFAGVHAHGYLSIPMQAGRKGCPGSKLASGTGPKDCSLTDGNDRSWFTDKTSCKSDVNITEDDWIEVDHGDGDIVHSLKNGAGVSSCPGKAPINAPCGWHLTGDDCGGTVLGKAHTDAKHFDGCDGRAKLNAFGNKGAEVTKWQAGSVQTVAWSVATPHGGLESYALCPVDEVGKDYHRDGATQKCFNAGRLKFANDKSCAWTAPGKEWSEKGCYESKSHDEYWQETWPRHWKHDKYSTMGVKSEVKVPSTLPSGRYVLQWEWDTDENQIWQSCADIEITGGGPAPTPEPTPAPTPQPAPTPSPSSSCEPYEVQKDTSSTVKSFKSVKASDLDDCCSACTAEGKCTHWAFAPEKNKCFLMSGSPKIESKKGHSLGIKQEELVTV